MFNVEKVPFIETSFEVKLFLSLMTVIEPAIQVRETYIMCIMFS